MMMSVGMGQWVELLIMLRHDLVTAEELRMMKVAHVEVPAVSNDKDLVGSIEQFVTHMSLKASL